MELKWLANQADSRKKLFNLERKRLPYSGSSKASTSTYDSRNGYVKEPAKQEKKEGENIAFRFKRLQKNFKGYLEQKSPSGPPHHHQFQLFLNIKEVLKKEREIVLMPQPSQIIYPKEMDPVSDLRRIPLPETINREINQRYKGAEPPQPMIKKSRGNFLLFLNILT